jgi:pimeloyl-ACP methyl ester carboxylesterase
MLAAISMRPPLTAAEERTESAINRMVGSDFVYWAAIRALPVKVLALLGVKEPVQRTMAEGERAIIYRVLEEMLPMTPRLPGIAVDQSLEMPETPLSQITCPVLVVHARDDTLVSIDYGLHTARSIPGAQWVPFETGGHFLAGHYEELRELVNRFLAGKVVAGTLEPVK